MDRVATRKNKDRLDRIIGLNIRAERELRKMSREELAELLDLTVSHMGLIERGERGATAVTLEKLRRVFTISIDSLFAEPDKKSLSVRERDDDNSSYIRRINSLLTRLNEKELEFVIHTIKGLVSFKPNRKDAD
ncbi:MAG: helix-turn-helix domain-containing protein [Defluviitaleaceae bacterium]|nr:helix-turn-helix domain-containing protein [Defluviitaleaceae bacterium]